MVAHLLITAIPLAGATVAALIAVWRRWAPPLVVSLGVGVALRLLLAAVAFADSWQPPDFMYQFTDAIHAVLRHQDPLQLPNAEWHFLPTMAYVNVAEYKLAYLIHLPWQFTGRIAPVVADIVLIPLVGLLAGSGDVRRRAALLYAVNPIAVLISAVHAQIEPVALVFAVAALLVANRRRSPASPRRWSPAAAQAGGVLLGVAIAVNSWPALLIPGLLRALPGWRARCAALAWTVGVPVLFLGTGPFVIGYPARFLVTDVHQLAVPRGVIGDWGWTTIVTDGNETVSTGWARLGTLILLVVLLGVWYLWRRAHPVDLLSALTLAFLTATDRLGDQYLLWPVPWQTARPTRTTQLWVVLGGAWVGAGELWLSHAPNDTAWWLMHQPWAYASLVLLPLLVSAMPWTRRVAPAGGEAGGRAVRPSGRTAPAASPTDATPLTDGSRSR